jgi:two-component system, NarL family, sensor histidine kinase UhpB
MAENDLLGSVAHTRARLAKLRGRLTTAAIAQDAPTLAQEFDGFLSTLEKLQSRYDLLREILDHTSDAVFAKDLEGRYVMLNPAWAELLGKTSSEVVGRDDRALLGAAEAARSMQTDSQILTDSVPLTQQEQTVNVHGHSRHVLTTKTPWFNQRGKLRGLIGIARDLPETKQSEQDQSLQQERLRTLACDYVVAEEGLRRTLANDLQAGAAQDIALARIRLASVRDSAGADLQEPLVAVEHLLEQADRSLRSITFQISPPPLADLGLLPALEWLAEDIVTRYGMVVRIEADGQPDVTDKDVRGVLYRAVRELLVNAAIHGGAHEARVRVAGTAATLDVVVSDDGMGFDAQAAFLHGHGLLGIREHMRHLGGSMNIDSAAERGTRVSLSTPIQGAPPIGVDGSAS